MLDNEEVYINDLSCEPSDFPNLSLLFQFVTREGSVAPGSDPNEAGPNPTAANYFYQIVESLANRNQIKTLSFVYSHRDVLKLLVHRADVAAFKSLLKSVTHFFRDDDKIDAAFKFLKYRFTLIKRMFDALLEDQRDLSNLPFLDRERLLQKERNLVDILSELVTSREKIVDAEYFLDRILAEKSNLKRLVGAIQAARSPPMLRFFGLLMGYLFEPSTRNNLKKTDAGAEGQRKMDKLRADMGGEDIQLELPDICIRNPRDAAAPTKEPDEGHERQAGMAIELNDGEAEIVDPGVQSPDFKSKMRPPVTPDEIVTPPPFDFRDDSENENQDQPQDNKSTAETSKGPVYNIEIELFDNQDLIKTKIAHHCALAVEFMLNELFYDPALLRSTSSRGSDSVQATGAYRIAVAKFLAAAIELQKVEDCIATCFTPSVVGSLLGLFEQYPTNNIFHIELTRLLETVIGHYSQSESGQGLITVIADKVAALTQKVRRGAPKPAASQFLFKSSLISLASALKCVFDPSGQIRLQPPDSWTDLSAFHEEETRVLDNKLFVPVRRSLMMAGDSLSKAFEINNFKINQIIERKQKQMINEEEELSPDLQAYRSNPADVNLELLNNLLINLQADSEGAKADGERYNDSDAYEVQLDLGINFDDERVYFETTEAKTEEVEGKREEVRIEVEEEADQGPQRGLSRERLER